MEQVNVDFPDHLKEASEDLAERRGYASLSELVREAVRGEVPDEMIERNLTDEATTKLKSILTSHPSVSMNQRRWVMAVAENRGKATPREVMSLLAELSVPSDTAETIADEYREAAGFDE